MRGGAAVHCRCIMTKPPIAALILAAGLGSRMKSSQPKVLHQIAGRPMLHHVAAALSPLGCDPVIAVIGPEMPADAVPPAVGSVVQVNRRGTGDAAKIALPLLEGFCGTVLIVAGDVPLIRDETLRRLAEARDGSVIAVAGFRAADPTGYGRLILDDRGGLSRVVEHKDATVEERAVTLCNAGLYAVEAQRLAAWLDQLKPDNAQGEYYLTDIVALARREGLTVAVVEAEEAEVLGVNSRGDLARVEAIAQNRLRAAAMAGGATLRDPASVFLSWDTKLGRDVTIGPQVVFGPGVIVADDVEIRSFSHLEGAVVETGAVIGPFARLRPGTRIGPRAHVGNFVELKNAVMGEGAKANHLSYLGDAVIGAAANIGAGTITCNYDGFTKALSEIGAGAFIGSNAALIAPVRIGADAIVAAGTVIGGDVPADAIVIARSEAQIRDGAAQRFRARRKAAKTGKGEL